MGEIDESVERPNHWRIKPITAARNTGVGSRTLMKEDTTLVNKHPFPGKLFGPTFESQVDDADALEVDADDGSYVCDLCSVPVRMYDSAYVSKLNHGGYHRWAVAVNCPDCSRKRVWTYSTKEEPDIHDVVDCYVNDKMTEYGLEYSFDQLATQENLHKYLEKRDSRWYSLKRTLMGVLR